MPHSVWPFNLSTQESK